MVIKNYIKRKLGIENLNFLYSELNKDVDMQFYDIGAAAGLQPQWNKVNRAFKYHLFEPHVESYNQLKEMFKGMPNVSIYNEALHDKDGIVSLTMTNVPTGSTLLEFDKNSEGHRYCDKDYIYPAKKVDLEVKKLDTVIQKNKIQKPDIIKLDTQGTELTILQSLNSEDLLNLTAIELEIGIVKSFISQKMYFEALGDLEKSGFLPYDFRIARTYIKKTGDPIYFSNFFKEKNENFFVASRSWEFDVVMFKSVEDVLSTGNLVKIKKLLISFLIYNFFYDAIDLLDRASERNLISSEEKERMILIIKRIYQTQKMQMISTLIRNKIKNVFNIFSKEYWARFIWVDYPNS